jgi:hypothetical protein
LVFTSAILAPWLAEGGRKRRKKDDNRQGNPFYEPIYHRNDSGDWPNAGYDLLSKDGEDMMALGKSQDRRLGRSSYSTAGLSLTKD